MNATEATACRCTARWVDDGCIWSTIEAWKPIGNILCKGCFENAPKCEDHECHGHLTRFIFPELFPEEVYPKLEARTSNTLRQPETIDALFKIYMKTYPDASADLKERMDWGIQRLMKTMLWKLLDIFAEKDRTAHKF